MNELRFGLEVLVVGFSVVIVALVLLSVILMGFNRFLAPKEKKDMTGSLQQQTKSEGDGQGQESGEQTEPSAALAKNEGQNEGQMETISVATDSSAPPEQVAAIAAAMYVEQEKQAGPEVIAAITGALSYLFEAPGSFAVDVPERGPEGNLWVEMGRTRLLQLRQDFVLLRRGILR